MERAKDDNHRAALRLLLGPQEAGRPFIAPPGTPPDYVKALRAAFDASMKDPELIAFAEKMNLELSPVPGEQIETACDVLPMFWRERRPVLRLRGIPVDRGAGDVMVVRLEFAKPLEQVRGARVEAFVG